MGLFDLIGSAISATPAGAVVGAASSIIDRVFPDKTQAEKDAAALELQKVMNQFNLVTAQTDINKVEAANTNWFVAGWRPYIGWVCGTGLGYQFLLMPVGNGVLAVVSATYAHVFVSLDSSTLLACLSGILGLGTLRTVEKHQDVEANR